MVALKKMNASNGKFVSKGQLISLDSVGHDCIDAGGATNWILVPSWTGRGIFGGGLNTGTQQNGKVNCKGGSRKRRRNGNGDGDCGSSRTTLEHMVRDEIRQCDVCARAILWTQSHERQYFQAHDPPPDDDASPPPQKSISECLPRFIERHVNITTPLPCSFCTTKGGMKRWCGSLYCSRDCQIRGEEGVRTKTGKDDEMPTTSKATSVSSLYSSFPKLLPPKLFFCRNRFCVGGNVAEEHVDLVDEILDSISAIERRFKSICGCDDSDIDRTIRIIGAEECALLLTTIIACICPDWIRELTGFRANENRIISFSEHINPGEESLVEELWAMSRSHSHVSEMLQGCNVQNFSSAGNTFPSYNEFLWCYLDTKRHCVLRVNLTTHPIVSYVTKTIISPSLTEMERGLALDLLMSPTLLSITLGSDIGHGTNNNNGSDVNNQDADQLSILQWRNAAHLAHQLSSTADAEGAQMMQIQTHLQKSYFAYSPRLFRRKSHSCVPTLALTVADLSQKETNDYHQSPLDSLAWLALHDIPSSELFTISKLDSLDGDIHTRLTELKRLMGQDFVCSCTRCEIEAREYDSGSNGKHLFLKHVADLAMQHGRFEDASTLYDSILRTHPHDGDVLHARAASYLGRASSSSFANHGHCQGYFIKAQRLWEQAGSIEGCSVHPGISTQVTKQRVYRTLQCCEALVSKETSINDDIAFTSYLDERCFVTNESPVLSLGECQHVINTAEHFAGGWTTTRHYAVPTTDIPLHELTELHEWFYQLWNERIRPL